MHFNNLKFELNKQVGMLQIHRPQALNALNQELLRELDQFIDQYPREMRCLIITGSGDRAFVAGADIREMKDISAEEAHQLSQTGQAIMNRLERMKVPTIAAVNGFALGGGFELALSCDFIVASEKAKFGLPEVSLGLIPGYGGTQRLARAIGKNKALMVALTGEQFSSQEALRWGITVQVVPHDQLIPECLKWAEKIVSRAPGALAYVKRAVHEGFDLNQFEGLKLEAELFGEVFKLEEAQEGIHAFLEKRSAQWG